jgi:hypothetical protein
MYEAVKLKRSCVLKTIDMLTHTTYFSNIWIRIRRMHEELKPKGMPQEERS